MNKITKKNKIHSRHFRKTKTIQYGGVGPEDDIKNLKNYIKFLRSYTFYDFIIIALFIISKKIQYSSNKILLGILDKGKDFFFLQPKQNNNFTKVNNMKIGLIKSNTFDFKKKCSKKYNVNCRTVYHTHYIITFLGIVYEFINTNNINNINKNTEAYKAYKIQFINEIWNKLERNTTVNFYDRIHNTSDKITKLLGIEPNIFEQNLIEFFNNKGELKKHIISIKKTGTKIIDLFTENRTNSKFKNKTSKQPHPTSNPQSHQPHRPPPPPPPQSHISYLNFKDPINLVRFQYLKWTDHGVPNMDEFKEFIDTVYCDMFITRTNTYIHCSAGVGRTGVIYMILNLLFKYNYMPTSCEDPTVKNDTKLDKIGTKNDKHFNFISNKFVQKNEIYDLLQQSRINRMGLVQTVDQYKFIYEYFGINIDPSVLTQFNKLNNEIPKINNEQFNKCKNLNRYQNILPYKESMPDICDTYSKPKKPVECDKTDCNNYINASTMGQLPNTEIEVFTGQCPTPDSYDNFMKMVIKHKIKRIIMVSGFEEYNTQTSKTIPKCDHYLPNTLNSQQTYLNNTITVKLNTIGSLYHNSNAICQTNNYLIYGHNIPPPNPILSPETTPEPTPEQRKVPEPERQKQHVVKEELNLTKILHGFYAPEETTFDENNNNSSNNRLI